MNRREFIALTCGTPVCLVAAGCSNDGPGPGSEQNPPAPANTPEFPEGPENPPQFPNELTLESASQFAKEFEYRFVYNRLWHEDNVSTSVDCEIEDASRNWSGYRAVVSCFGSANRASGSNTSESGDSTTTTMVLDYFAEPFVYTIDEGEVTRERKD